MAEPFDPSRRTDTPQENPVHPTEQFATDVPPTRDTAVLGDTWAAPPAPAPPQEKRPDVVALVAGVVFVLIAVIGTTGVDLPGWVFGGGALAVLLVLAGIALLVSELRKKR